MTLAAAARMEGLEGRLLFSTYTVTTLGDSAGVVTSAGTNKFNATTLRAALTGANTHVGADTINFAAGLVGTINLGSALPAVADALKVFGPGASKITVQRSSTATTNFSVFQINSGTTATLAGLTIAKGTGNPARNGYGGGIYNAGTLTVTNCTVSGNTPTGTTGGGIFNEFTGTLTLIRDTISGNSATFGGGVYNAHTLVLDHCTFSGNSASDGGGLFNSGTATLSAATFTANAADARSGGTGSGGGIFSTGTLTLTAGTLTGNTANSRGGAIDNHGGTMSVTLATFAGNSAFNGGGAFNLGTLTVTACTLSGNQADFEGGAIHNNPLNGPGATLVVRDATLGGNSAYYGGGVYNSAGAVTLTNATVSGNSAGGIGGGIYTTNATPTLGNSIVVGNVRETPPTTQPDEIFGTANAASSFNVIGTAGKGGLTNGVNGNKVGVSLAALKLGALASNGGPTKTMALLAGSSAIDAGSNSLASAAHLFADQRGLPRVVGGRIDVGAYEFQKSGGGSIAGTFFNDTNRDGARQSTEPLLAGWQIYLDQNKDGVYNPGEQTAFSSSTGVYKFTGLAVGTYRVREIRQEGWTRTRPAGAYPLGYYDVTINLAVNGGAVAGKDFANYFA